MVATSLRAAALSFGSILGRTVVLVLGTVPGSGEKRTAVTSLHKPTAGLWITVALVVVLVG